MKIVESKDVLRIKKVYIEELSSAQTILIASHLKCSASRHVNNSNASLSADLCLV